MPTLSKTPIILTPGLEAITKSMSEKFYQELDSEFGGFKGHVLVISYQFDQPWGVWEMHPHGDEIVYLLSGGTDFVLRTQTGEKTIRVDQVGDYVVVPKGMWHTANPHAPTSMLFITPGEGTENREQPGV